MEKGWQHNYDLGKRSFDERNYDIALQYLEKVAAEKSQFADVYNMLGLIYYYGSRFEDAIKAFRKAIEINPAYTEASLNLSVVYNELGQFERSSEVYAMAREGRKDAESYLDPYVKGKLANMHSGLGAIYKDLGFYNEAADEFKKALKLRPGFVDIKTSLGVVYRDMKDYENALRELEETVSQNPEYAHSRVQLGLTYYTMGQQEKARSEWLKVLRANPEDKVAQMYMNLLLTPKA
jgi:tetratricopeptide (TPR) repeat protein